MRFLFGIVVLVALFAYGGYVAVSNDATVSINLLFTQLENVRLWLALLAAFAAGAGFTGLTCAWPLLRLRLRARRQRRQIASLEQEIHGLRTLPLDEELSSNAPAAEN